MGRRDWEKFFEYVREIVEEQGLTWEEKKQRVLGHAKEEGEEINFEEFVAWFAE